MSVSVPLQRPEAGRMDADHEGSQHAPVPDFRQIYDEYHHFVWRLLVHLGVRESDASDMTHSVFLVAYRKLPEFEQRSTLRTWLYGITLRVARDFLRSAAVRREVTREGVLEEERASTQDSADALHVKRQLALAERVLDSLSAEQREVFVLHELEQMTGPEIQELLGVPLGTVRSRLRLARENFRQQVTQLREEGLIDG